MIQNDKQGMSDDSHRLGIRRIPYWCPEPIINLNKKGTLLKCTSPVGFTANGGTQFRAVERGDVLMYLGCWYFKVKVSPEAWARLKDPGIKDWWNMPRYNAMLNFLHGEEIVKIVFQDSISLRLGLAHIKHHALYKAASWMYAHFQLAM